MESLPFEEGGILKMETKEILDDIVIYIKENIGERLTVGELADIQYKKQAIRIPAAAIIKNKEKPQNQHKSIDFVVFFSSFF